MNLREFLANFNFDYDIVSNDNVYETVLRQQLINDGELNKDDMDKDLIYLIDLDGANLGDIHLERYPISQDSVLKIIERMDVYITDSLIAEFDEALMDRGISNTEDYSLEAAVLKCKDLGVGDGEVCYELADVIIHPEKITIDEVIPETGLVKDIKKLLAEHDNEFLYKLLGRMKADCDYYLGYGNRYPKHLWAGDEKAQIEYMKAIWNHFKDDAKPERLSMEDIVDYENRMVKMNRETVILSIEDVEKALIKAMDVLDAAEKSNIKIHPSVTNSIITSRLNISETLNFLYQNLPNMSKYNMPLEDKIKFAEEKADKCKSPHNTDSKLKDAAVSFEKNENMR